MIVLSDKKYACESCIKGHRSSSCKHTERPLFEVKKKGRPVTQCEHCRQLRKTKQVHVKCLCGGATDPPAAAASSDAPGTINSVPIAASTEPRTSGSALAAASQVGVVEAARSPAPAPVPAPVGYKRQRVKKPLPSAAFPGGLPAEMLEVSRALQMLAEGSDAERSPKACHCDATGVCECAEHRPPRKQQPPPPPPKPAAPASSTSGSAPGTHARSLSPKPPAVKVHYRPVLPRPTSSEAAASGPVHDPSAPAAHPHPHAARHAALYSPYGRAHARSLALQGLDTSAPAPPDGHPPTHVAHEQPFAPPQTPTDTSFPAWLLPPSGAADAVPLPACSCGPTCACPGCGEHADLSGAPDLRAAFALCADPAGCGLCLQCAIAAMPAAYPGADADADEYAAIDEWARQVEAHAQRFGPPPPVNGGAAPPFGFDPPAQPPPDSASMAALQRARDPDATPLPQWFYPLPGYEPGGGEDAYAGFAPYAAAGCGCAPGQCTCPPEQCECEGEDTPAGRLGLTFATSGERARCCAAHPPPPPAPPMLAPRAVPAFPAGLGAYPSDSEGWYIVTSSSDGSASPPRSSASGPSSRRSSYSAPRPPFIAGLGRMASMRDNATSSSSGYDASFGDMQLF